MNYPQTKVYFDGSHYIGIPHITQSFKKRKNELKAKDEKEQKVKEIYKESIGTKKEKSEKTIKEINKEINDIEKSTKLVNEILEKDKRNRIVRQTRLSRKLGLQNWTHFCTFTYDSQKLIEEEFRKKFLNCLRHLSNRKGWKYIGVFERSPKVNRLHFHGIFVIKEMVGKILETKDYSTKTHQMQTTNQNTYFLERFGRNDFREIYSGGVQDAVNYILKYIRKTGEKVIYSKHIQTYFITDILEDDVVCNIGQEERKILLFDNFNCLDFETGEILGQVNKELIQQLPKGY
ncbi:MAG: hypothetical protein E7359_03160 [Clostridiales bacterium]|nr:hypothetical protein [Clostridiales bacterium]